MGKTLEEIRNLLKTNNYTFVGSWDVEEIVGCRENYHTFGNRCILEQIEISKTEIEDDNSEDEERYTVYTVYPYIEETDYMGEDEGIFTTYNEALEFAKTLVDYVDKGLTDYKIQKGAFVGKASKELRNLLETNEYTFLSYYVMEIVGLRTDCCTFRDKNVLESIKIDEIEIEIEIDEDEEEVYTAYAVYTYDEETKCCGEYEEIFATHDEALEFAKTLVDYIDKELID